MVLLVSWYTLDICGLSGPGAGGSTGTGAVGGFGQFRIPSGLLRWLRLRSKIQATIIIITSAPTPPTTPPTIAAMFGDEVVGTGVVVVVPELEGVAVGVLGGL